MISSLWWSSPPSSSDKPPGTCSPAPCPRLRRSLRSTWRSWTRWTRRRRTSSTSSPGARSWRRWPRLPHSSGRNSPPWRSFGATPTTSPSSVWMTSRCVDVVAVSSQLSAVTVTCLSLDKCWLLEHIRGEVRAAADSHHHGTETNWRC